MLNRIRISTTLFLILILCGVLQVGSNGLSFWAFRDGYQNLQDVEASNQQRSALAQTRAVLLQASTALNKAGTLTALSYPPDDIKALMATARDSLKQADAQFKAFAAQATGSEKEKALKAAMKTHFEQWYSDLDHQATWLENNQLSDFMTAPVQASQAAFDGSFDAWQQDINQSVLRAGEASRTSYHMSGVIFGVMVILAGLLTGAALSIAIFCVSPHGSDRRRAALVTQNDCAAAGDYQQPLRQHCERRPGASGGGVRQKRNFGDLCQPEGDAGIAAGNGIRRASGQLCHAHRDLRDCGG